MSVVAITKQPLLPIVTITKNDTTTYVFNHFTSTYGFRLRALHAIPPKDGANGEFSITLTSNTAANADTNTLLSNIGRGNEILIEVGKTNNTKQKIIRGMVENMEIVEQTGSYMDVTLSGPDWGSALLGSRIVNGQWVQEREVDGIIYKNDDVNVTIKQIVLDLLTKTTSYPAVDVAVSSQGLGVSADNIKVDDIKLSAFSANFELLSDKLTELAALAGKAFWWVDPDKIFHMELPDENTTSRPAEILITDDYSNSTALAWDQTKVGLIGLGSTFKATVENRKSRVYGLGGNGEEIGTNKQESKSGGSTSLVGQYLARKFTPTKKNLEGVSLYVKKVGDPHVSNLTLLIVEDLNGEPKGDTYAAKRLEKLKISSSGGWATWKTETELNTAKDYWIVLQKNTQDDADNHFEWFHGGTNNTATATSTNGSDWTISANGKNYTFRPYYIYPIISIHADGTSLATSKHYHETVISYPDIKLLPTLFKLVNGEATTLFKEKEILTCSVYAPDTVLKQGQRVKVIKTASGKSINTQTDGKGDYVLGSVSYDFEATNDKGTGTFWYQCELVRFVPYT